MIRNIVAVILLFTLSPLTVFADNPGSATSEPRQQPVIALEIAADVSEEEAIEAMISKAGELNLVVVAVHNSKYVTSLELCAPSIAEVLLRFDPTLSVYVPCRVTVIDRKIMTLDFSNVIQKLPPDLQKLAGSVVQRVGEIMHAGSIGEF
ncbi:MAG: DUF302 domain-containing protein [Gammaproteobacteria bacterium]|nr:DUF302 domain-containing protein [Gammaproteobacteria bacterium]